MASIGRASAMLASGTMVSRVLGFARSWILIQAVGATAVGANAYSTATVVPNSIYAIISQGILSAILVPQIVRASVNKDGGRAYINKLVTLGMLMALNRSVELKTHIRGALNNGLSIDEIAEVFLHGAAYCGFPAAMTSLRLAKEVVAANP